MLAAFSPKRGVTLTEAVAAAMSRYPAAGQLLFGTTLCITHKCRIFVKSLVNNALARSDAVFVPAVHECGINDANQPQDMKVWEGIILIARCGSNARHLKNGVRYKLLAIVAERYPYDGASESGQGQSPEASFEMLAVDDEDAPVGDSFLLTQEELGSKM